MATQFRKLDAIYLSLLIAISACVWHALNLNWINPFGYEHPRFIANAIVAACVVMSAVITIHDPYLRTGWFRCPGRAALMGVAATMAACIIARSPIIFSLRYRMSPQPSWISMVLDQLLYRPFLLPSSRVGAFCLAFVVVLSWASQILFVRSRIRPSRRWNSVLGVLSALYWIHFAYTSNS